MSASDAPQTWLLLRGLTRDARHWGAFPAQFQQQFPAARIVTPDLAGNGLRHRERSPASIAAMVADLRTQLQLQQLAPPYRVLALSLGAMVAVEWMRQAPADIATAVLINTSLRPYCRLTQRLRISAWPKLLGVARHASAAREAERRILKLTSHRASARGEVLDDWARWRSTHPVSPANALRQLAAAARFRAQAPAAATRVLLLVSATDRLVDAACSRQIAATWNRPLREHPWAGHDLPLDDGKWIADTVRDWI